MIEKRIAPKRLTCDRCKRLILGGMLVGKKTGRHICLYCASILQKLGQDYDADSPECKSASFGMKLLICMILCSIFGTALFIACMIAAK